MSDIRQELISKLFPSSSSENLIVHVKTYQDIQSNGNNTDAKGTARYLCLTQKKNTMRLLKVKRNHNGSFSISKTWSLDDIKQIQIIDTHQFSLTLNKTYVWAVERSKDKMIFLAFLIDSCKRSATRMPKLVNIDESRIIRYLADPSAPTMGSNKISLPGNDSDGFLNRSAQSPTSSSHFTNSPREDSFPSQSPRETSFPPSPTTSSVYNSLPMSARSMRSSMASEKEYYHTLPKQQQYKRASLSSAFNNNDTNADGFLEREPYHERLNNEDRIRRKEQEEKQHRFEEEQRRKKQVEQLKIAESQIPEETHTNKEERLEEKAEVVPEKIAKHASLMNSKELMSGYDWKTKGNTVAAEKKLLSELHSIDAANLQATIHSEEQIKSIIEHIDRSLEELNSMENWLSRYGTRTNGNVKNTLEKA